MFLCLFFFSLTRFCPPLHKTKTHTDLENPGNLTYIPGAAILFGLSLASFLTTPCLYRPALEILINSSAREKRDFDN